MKTPAWLAPTMMAAAFVLCFATPASAGQLVLACDIKTDLGPPPNCTGLWALRTQVAVRSTGYDVTNVDDPECGPGTKDNFNALIGRIRDGVAASAGKEAARWARAAGDPIDVIKDQTVSAAVLPSVNGDLQAALTRAPSRAPYAGCGFVLAVLPPSAKIEGIQLVGWSVEQGPKSCGTGAAACELAAARFDSMPFEPPGTAPAGAPQVRAAIF